MPATGPVAAMDAKEQQPIMPVIMFIHFFTADRACSERKQPSYFGRRSLILYDELSVADGRMNPDLNSRIRCKCSPIVCSIVLCRLLVIDIVYW